MSASVEVGDFWGCLRAASPKDAQETLVIRCNETQEALIRFRVPRTDRKHPNGYEWGRPLFCRFEKKLWGYFGRLRSTDLAAKLFGDMSKVVGIRTTKLIKELPGNVRYVFCYTHEDEDILDFGSASSQGDNARPAWMKHECFYCNRNDKVARSKRAQVQLDKINNKKRKAERAEECARKKKQKEERADDVAMSAEDEEAEDSDDYSGTWKEDKE